MKAAYPQQAGTETGCDGRTPGEFEIAANSQQAAIKVGCDGRTPGDLEMATNSQQVSGKDVIAFSSGMQDGRPGPDGHSKSMPSVAVWYQQRLMIHEIAV